MPGPPEPDHYQDPDPNGDGRCVTCGVPWRIHGASTIPITGPRRKHRKFRLELPSNEDMIARLRHLRRASMRKKGVGG